MWSKQQGGEAMNKPAKTFEDLNAWRRSHEFVLEVYRLTESFPKSELYGLTSQLRRAAVSIPANIAEGFKKTGKLDKLRFLNTSQGSLEECRYYLLLATDLHYGTVEQARSLLEEASRLLHSYSSAIRRQLAIRAAGGAAVLAACAGCFQFLTSAF
jgi:four helix bundle protein